MWTDSFDLKFLGLCPFLCLFIYSMEGQYKQRDILGIKEVFIVDEKIEGFLEDKSLTSQI